MGQTNVQLYAHYENVINYLVFSDGIVDANVLVYRFGLERCPSCKMPFQSIMVEISGTNCVYYPFLLLERCPLLRLPGGWHSRICFGSLSSFVPPTCPYHILDVFVRCMSSFIMLCTTYDSTNALKRRQYVSQCSVFLVCRLLAY